MFGVVVKYKKHVHRTYIGGHIIDICEQNLCSIVIKSTSPV